MGKEVQNIPTSVLNSKVVEQLDRGEMDKVAQASTEYTRIQIREDSFAFKILPPEKATDDMLDRDLDERLRVIWELEPDSPGSMWVPLQTIPEGEYIKGSRYQIPFARLVTKKYVKDVDELRTYRQDIRKILTDNSIKDGLAEIDTKFADVCKAITEDTAGVVPGPNNFTGKVQWRGFSGGLTKENFIEAKKMLPRGSTTMAGKFRLRNYIALMNDVTAQDWLKLTVPEAGDNTVEKMFNEGLTTDTYLGIKCIFTIKDDIIPDNTVYFFAAPEFLGKCFYMTDWTMYMKKEAYFIEMFSYWMGGFAFGNVAGVCKADFDYTAP
ncbi:hypothetical protein ACFLQL_00160 [Verrucomicrobiota bacterium]